ncbi:hypothetical protein JW935_03020 [candidate division KSB1 bacterium]|nr:hypothetical protein [candidate division KSB1 bacterium]
MLVFERTIIKRYWPADEKGEDKEIIRQVVIQVEAELDNSLQVGELFNNMVRGLVQVAFLDNTSGEEYLLPAVTIKPFNVKQKKVKIGKGPDAEVVKTEFAAVTLVCRLQDNGGKVISDLYRFFNMDVQMTIDQFKQTAPPVTEKIEEEFSIEPTEDF